jgi:hypothetical protein
MTHSSLSHTHRGRWHAPGQTPHVGHRLPAPLPTFLLFLLLAGLGAAVVVFASSGADTGTGAIAGTVRDTAGGPLAGASVLVATTPLATLSGIDGTFRIDGLSAGSYALEVRLAGYRPAHVADLRVKQGATVQAEVRLEREGAGVVSPGATPPERDGSAKTRAETEAKRGDGGGLDALRSLDSPDASSPMPSRAEEMGSGRQELRMSMMKPPSASDRASGLAPLPRMVPTTGGSRLPNDEAFDSMFFRHYGVNPFVPTDAAAELVSVLEQASRLEGQLSRNEEE